ncbi:MAG TPA: U32 family peptidase [Myxococcota bacterium]|nr:U32 family peptidase [Myxococcota bacterium]HRY94147.1 U32 family peptidase [Myxococcota bacterium]HSA21880.1 U32 family peptidase [Myxococcota bacterium]
MTQAGPSTDRPPELLAPAGGFEAAWHAFEAGADAVYLGLGDFSARKAARNFSWDELRVLRRLAGERGRRVYVAVNTVVGAAELPRLAERLFELELLGVDAVIVQDLGVLSLLRRSFPGLAVHASTQMAVHDGRGLDELVRLGVRRVILPRELSRDEIAALHRRQPGLELEVFVHGALCYSFSGACLASGLLLGRSGNRGECAQLCRGWYEVRGRRDYLFSCNDLALEEDALGLGALGVRALKIEGRMKPPEYVRAVVALYRALLDRGGRLPPGELEEHRRRIALTFARGATQGFLGDRRGERLLSRDYPAHRGVPLGKVERRDPSGFTLTLGQPVGLHDGLMYFGPGQPPEPVRFPLLHLRRHPLRAGAEAAPVATPVARAGERVSIACPDPPPVGREVFLISSRALDLRAVKPGSLPPHVVPLAARAELAADGLTLSAALGGRELRRSYPLAVEPARVPKDFRAVLAALLAESGTHPFQVQAVELRVASGLDAGRLFVRPSVLKRVKNEFYLALEENLAGARSERVAQALAGGPPLELAAWPQGLRAELPRRLLSPPGALPFAARVGGPEGLAAVDGLVALPLKPIALADEDYYPAVERLCLSRPELRFLVGLNNLAQLPFARELGARAAHVSFFGDVYTYLANPAAVRFLFGAVPRLLFAYGWLEGTAEQRAALRAELPAELAGRVLEPGPGFAPPLFVSRVCLARHALDACRPDCPRDFSYELREGGRTWRAVVADCLTYVFSSGAGA